MNFQQLQYFQEVVKCGNISKASSLLHVSRQTVSSLINSLEKELGYPLLNREKSGVELSEEGRMFYSRIEDFFQDGYQIMDDMMQYRNQYRLPVDIGLWQGIEYPIYNALFEYQKKHPFVDMKITFISGKRNSLNLYNSKIDFVISVYQEQIGSRFKKERVAEYPLYIAINKRNPLTVKEEISLSDLSEHVLLSHILDYDVMQKVFLKEYSYELNHEHYFYCEDYNFILSMLDNNYGIMFCHSQSAVNKMENILVKPLKGEFTYPIYLSCKEQLLRDEKYEKVLEEVKQFIQESVKKTLTL